MASTQKTIALVFLINLMIGLGLTIYDTTNVDAGYLTGEIEQYKEFEDILEETEQNEPTSDVNDFKESTYGNTVGWGRILFKVFIDGVNPLSTSLQTLSTESMIENMVMHGLSVFRAILYILIAVELYMVVKNKKTS